MKGLAVIAWVLAAFEAIASCVEVFKGHLPEATHMVCLATLTAVCAESFARHGERS